MARNAESTTSPAVVLAASAVVVASLYLAREVLIPLALAVLLSFILGPVVVRLQRLGLGRIVATVLVVIATFCLVGLLIYMVTDQLVDLANSLPQYRANIQKRVAALSLDGPAKGPVGRAMEQIKQLGHELTTTQPASTAGPVPVRVVPGEPNLVQVLRSSLGPVLQQLGLAGIVLVFVVFILVQQEDLRDRLLRLIGQGRIHLSTQALDEAAARVSRYLVAQSIVNGSYGLAIGVGLYFIGIPNAVLWGLLAAVLRFVPYLGPWIAASLPLAVALATFSDWRHFLLAAGLFVVIELLSNNFMEPWLYGSSTGMSNLAILVAAVFWTWLWGPVGLVLSTPLTVCLAVVGKYVPQLQFINVMLSDEEVLAAPVRLYQRLLAMDEVEAGEQVEQHLQDKSLQQLYDQVMLPALALEEQDRHRGRLEDWRRDSVLATLAGLVNEAAQASADKTSTPPAKPAQPQRILVLPAHDEADEVAADMLARLLERCGHEVQTLSVARLASEMVQFVEQYRPQIVCISALPPAALPSVRYLYKRLRQRLGEARLLVGLWTASDEPKRLQSRLEIGQEPVVVSLGEAMAQISHWAPLG